MALIEGTVIDNWGDMIEDYVEYLSSSSGNTGAAVGSGRTRKAAGLRVQVATIQKTGAKVGPYKPELMALLFGDLG